MTDLVRAIRQELASIETDMGKLTAEAEKLNAKLREKGEKAEKLKAVLLLYEDDGAEGDADGQRPLFVSGQVVRLSSRPLLSSAAIVGVSSTPHMSKAAMVKAAVIQLLHEKGTEHRQKILGYLVERGLMGNEKNPMASLAAYLSENKELFSPDGKGNFSLTVEGKLASSVPEDRRSSGTQRDQGSSRLS